MKVYMFPGQGSQVKGMGVGLFSLFPELVASADNILGYSIQTLCEEDPQKVLNLTQFTQPALYVVNAFMYLKKLQEAGFSKENIKSKVSSVNPPEDCEYWKANTMLTPIVIK